MTSLSLPATISSVKNSLTMGGSAVRKKPRCWRCMMSASWSRSKYNAITIDGEGRIVFFEEKPKNPTSTLTGIALYHYPRSTLPLIEQYIAEGNNPDQPGRLVQWLYPRLPVYTWK